MAHYLSEEDTKIIRNAIGKPMLTNCYLSYHTIQKKIADGEMSIFSHEDIVALVQRAHEMYKMYYFLRDSRDLPKNVCQDLRKKMSSYNTLITEIIAREGEIKNFFVENIGFSIYKKYFRLQLSIDKEKVFPSKEKSVFADEMDCNEIYELLYSSFDILSDHLLTKEELKQSLRSQQIIKICRDNVLAGALIFEKQGVKSYLRTLCVNPIYKNEKIGSSLVSNYINIHKKESRLFYLWVESTNHSAIRLYEKFGYRQDGLIDFIFVHRNCAND